MKHETQSVPEGSAPVDSDQLQPTIERDGFVTPGFSVAVRVRAIPLEDHDFLGRRVREEWVKWATEQPNPKPSWLVPWDQLPEADKDVDRRIGVALANLGRYRYVDVE